MATLTKSQLNRRRERELVDAGGYRLPGGTLQPAQGAALRRLMARFPDASRAGMIGKALVIADRVTARAAARKGGVKTTG